MSSHDEDSEYECYLHLKQKKTKNKTKKTKKKTNKILHIKKELNTIGKTKKGIVMTSCSDAFILVMNGHTNVCVGKKRKERKTAQKLRTF